MHEHKFTEQIVQSVLDELKSHPDLRRGRPRCVNVVAGDIYHLEPDSVRLHFDLLIKDTPLAGTALNLQTEALEVHCKDCGKVGGVEDHHFPVCGICGSLLVDVTKGNRVDIQLVEAGD